MLISFSTGSLYNLKLETVFDIANKAGFEYLELMLRGKDEILNTNNWNVDYLKRLEREHNLKIKTVHVPLDFEFYPEEYLQKTINLAKDVEADYLIMHLPKNKEKFAHYISWFEQFKDKINQQDVAILIENMGRNDSYKNSKDYNQFSNFCFDTCHSLKHGSNTIGTIADMKNIRQFHLNYFDGQESHLRPTLNKELFKKILSLAPDAYRCLEISPLAFSSDSNVEVIIQELKQELEFVKNI